MNREILRKSKGIKVKKGDRVFVRYEGQLTNGDIFDRNFNFADFEAAEGRDIFSFVLGQGQVIQGWEIGLNGARLGQVLRLVIPPELAYGNADKPGIPPNSTLEFTVEVVGYSKADKATPAAYELDDIGIKLTKLGLSEKILKKISSGKIGLNIDDTLVGTSAKDLLTGLGGQNDVIGGLGGDLLISAKGADTFRYIDTNDSLPGKKARDIIAGFNKNDRIDLTAFSGNQELTFIGNKKLTGASGEIRYEKGIIGIDFNGDKRNDFEIELVGSPRIGASNFLL